MKKVLILVEGQTEETFVRDVLAEHLLGYGVYVHATIANTKRVKRGKNFKGGIVSYQRVKRDIQRLLRDSSAVMVTTMIDYYKLPNEFPSSLDVPQGNCYSRISHIENALGKDINHVKFRPYLQLHEYEAVLFVEPQVTAAALGKPSKASKIAAIRAQYSSPEEINEGETSSPSKRIMQIFPEYEKAFHGPVIASRIGLGRIRVECDHLNRWLRDLEQLGSMTT